MASTISGSNAANTLDNASGAISGDVLYLGLGGNDTIIAGTANDTLDGGTGNDDLRGGAGNDTYIFDSLSDTLLESANQGIDTLVIDAVNNIVVAAGYVLDLVSLVNVENIDISRTNLQLLNIGGNNLNNVLTGNNANNEIYGYIGADSLIGGLGNDYLDGGAGIDTMNGGAGDDVYIVDNVADVITDAEGLNEVRATISYSVANNLAFDNLVLLGTDAINATGNSLNNLLLGNAGDNILDGGAGADAMEGGKGNDTYLWREAGDTFFELANEGIDTLQLASDFGFAAGAAATASLGGNIENLDASNIGGVAFHLMGNALSNILTGNDADNNFSGEDGDDTMFGGAGNDGFLGGLGIDSLVGGIGDDIYAVNLKLSGVAGTISAVASLEDIIVESSSSVGGIDSLRLDGGTTNLALASTIVLVTGLEHLYAENTIDTKLNLTGNAASNNIIGNNAANIILGLAGDDTLRGGGGDDTLDGGAGNNVYLGGSGNDTYLSELVLLGGLTHVNDTYSADESGIDTIKFSGQVNSASVLELSLANLSGYENTDISNTGNTNINLVGNDLNNNLTGNDGNNFLRGDAGDDTLVGGLGNDTLGGGYGSDLLNGGAGDDMYIIDVSTDIIQADLSGTDTVQVKYTTGLYTLATDLEHISLFGTANIDGTGNAGNNNLTGNDGNNFLRGDAGDDTLVGGLGNDTLGGGFGSDMLTGGLGADTFDFNAFTESLVGAARDIITDFSQVQLDKIDLSTIDANTTLANDQAFLATILNSGAFTEIGQLRLIGDILSGNSDSDFSTSEFEVQLTGVTSLISTDFYL